jgi:L-lactate utilization protein LutB
MLSTICGVCTAVCSADVGVGCELMHRAKRDELKELEEEEGRLDTERMLRRDERPRRNIILED